MKYINKFFCSIIVLFSMSFMSLVSAMDADLGGQHRVRWVYYKQDLSGEFLQRFKLAGDFRPNEMFESHFWLMSNHQWNTVEKMDVRVYGYGDWKVMDEVMIRLGRSPFQIADGSSVGLNDYENFPYIWDGGFVTYNTESIILDTWFAHAPAYAEGERVVDSFYKSVGASLSVRSLPEFFKNANLFFFYAFSDGPADSAPVSISPNAQQSSPTTSAIHVGGPGHYRVGLSLGGSYSVVDYKVNGAMHGTKIGDIMQQYFVDALLGWKVINGVGVHGRVHYESDEYDSFYYTRHAQSGLLDVVEWGKGAQFYELGVSYMPFDDFELGLNAVYFSSFAKHGQWTWSELAENVSKQDVAEAAVYLKKSYSGGFALELQGGFFDVLGDVRYLQVQCNTSFDF